MNAQKFFNNTSGQTLLEKFQRIVAGMGETFHTFLAVTGYFRSSGYFKVRAALAHTKKIRVLVGIDLDDMFRGRDKRYFFSLPTEEARTRYAAEWVRDVGEAGYNAKIEEGIRQFCKDVADGTLELRIHPSKNLHAKFYLCLPEQYSPETDGWVIMGSSNLTDSGLGAERTPRYELNVAMKDAPEVAYCKEEFDRLWEEGVLVRTEDVEGALKRTHLGQNPTPFELYVRVLIALFGNQVEDDAPVDLPDGFRNLKYQQDAVIQGYQMLLRYGGFFLADVVGLGKTVVAAMIAKRFVEANGRQTRVLVVHPPAVETTWRETFERFRFRSCNVQFVSSGSLEKVLKEQKNYFPKEEFDLVIVDEAHNFRNDWVERYDALQQICKAPRDRQGFVPGRHKKVMLISATPLNNGPEDLRNQLLLFQDARRGNIEGIKDVGAFFSPLIAEYKRIQKERKADGGQDRVCEVDALYRKIQSELLQYVTVRRTRHNILDNPNYREDLEEQGIVFPEVKKPCEVTYRLDIDVETLFWETLTLLVEQLAYARYRAVEFLKPEFARRYSAPKQIADILSGVYKVHMVKRLESSFYAFKKSLRTFVSSTRRMLEMADEDKILIIAKLNVNQLLDQGLTFDEVVERVLGRQEGLKKEDVCYPKAAFRPEFFELLRKDLETLQAFEARWQAVECDPKLEKFVELCRTELFQMERNPSQRLVIFSESVDTLTYLQDRLREALGRSDILMVSSKTRGALEKKIRASFDANAKEQDDVYRILLSSDVLAEGINLHRANVIVNYDTPWNATRLMQRIGRVNRIGSPAGHIYNYMFYPSKQGDKAIGLYWNAIFKLQGVHSALGEDSQIYSHEEMLREFQLFDPNVKDDTDKMLGYLHWLKRFRRENPQHYDRLSKLPLKSRALRAAPPALKVPPESIAFVATAHRQAFYCMAGGKAEKLTTLEALARLEAGSEERSLQWAGSAQEVHYRDVCAALAAFEAATDEAAEQDDAVATPTSGTAGTASKFLRLCVRSWACEGAPLEFLERLEKTVSAGTFNQLEKALVRLYKKYKAIPQEGSARVELRDRLFELAKKYCAGTGERTAALPQDEGDATLVIAETFMR